MKIGLHTPDQTQFPNLVLMKLSAAHKALGDDVGVFRPEGVYDKVYSSKVFTWTPETPGLPVTTERGGTGYGLPSVVLPDEIEHICPDYSLFGSGDTSYGFLTRGCPNKCPWCFVPGKEGEIRANADISEFLRHRQVVLMDNNVLASDHGITQIEKLGRLGVKVDFNQGLDARRIDDQIARRLSKLKWLKPVRLACDTDSQMEPVRRAVELLRWHNTKPRTYFCYVLVKDVGKALEIVKFLKGLNVEPFCQPYRSPTGAEPSYLQKAFARWVNARPVYNSVLWDDYDYNPKNSRHLR